MHRGAQTRPPHLRRSLITQSFKAAVATIRLRPTVTLSKAPFPRSSYIFVRPKLVAAMTSGIVKNSLFEFSFMLTISPVVEGLPRTAFYHDGHTRRYIWRNSQGRFS